MRDTSFNLTKEADPTTPRDAANGQMSVKDPDTKRAVISYVMIVFGLVYLIAAWFLLPHFIEKQVDLGAYLGITLGVMLMSAFVLCFLIPIRPVIVLLFLLTVADLFLGKSVGLATAVSVHFGMCAVMVNGLLGVFVASGHETED